MVDLKEFRVILNFKINFSKSKILPLYLPQAIVGALIQFFPFEWNTSSINYLAIYLTSDLTKLYKGNYIPLLQIIKWALEEWNKATFTWFGRIIIIRINYQGFCFSCRWCPLPFWKLFKLPKLPILWGFFWLFHPSPLTPFVILWVFKSSSVGDTGDISLSFFIEEQSQFSMSIFFLLYSLVSASLWLPCCMQPYCCIPCGTL